MSKYRITVFRSKVAGGGTHTSHTVYAETESVAIAMAIEKVRRQYGDEYTYESSKIEKLD